MNLKNFLRDKILLLLLHMTCLGVLTGFLRMTNYPASHIFLIWIFWFLILSVWFMVSFFQRKKYFQKLEKILNDIDKPYLLGELMPQSFLLEDRLYADMIHRSNKSVIEEIRRLEEEQKEYREYIESWVHEVKAPITAISLLCENRRKGGERENISVLKEGFRNVGMENQRIENQVDMVLFYARSEQVYKDYMIQETDLKQIVYEVLEKNKLLLLHEKIRAEVCCEDTVYTDGKWIAFIINQILLNSVKYCGGNGIFKFYTESGDNGVILTVEDNGTGIRPEELPRIFEKGFTGSNGREHEHATGMGLYLCKKLCDKLGIGIWAESEYGKGTRVVLEFPVSRLVVR